MSSLLKMNLKQFLDDVASNSPAPGGGSVAAVAGALGSALTSMVCRLTVGKKKYADVEEEMKKTLDASEVLRKRFEELADEDTNSFNIVMKAYGLPKETPEQQATRNAEIQKALKNAALVPLSTMRLCVEAAALAKSAAEKGNKNSISDAGVSALLLQTALEGAKLNVLVNLNGVDDGEFDAVTSEETERLTSTMKKTVDAVMDAVAAHLG